MLETVLQTLSKREVLFGIVLYSLLLGGVWGAWQFVVHVYSWITHVSFCCKEIARLNRELQRLQATMLQSKLSSGLQIERISVIPPPLPSQTSADWSDDHKPTQVKNT
jgi:hypothetical protein